jgi:succinoglycan biosynthesis protein ExoU
MAEVAVLIACYESARWIGRAVSSALAQPEVAEVIVIDDASTDASIAAAEAANDGSSRLQIFRQPINRGPAVARNRGLALVRSPWVAILDADDFFLPGRFSRLLPYTAIADFVADDPMRMWEDDRDGSRQAILGLQKPIWVNFADFVQGNVSSSRRPWREWGYVQPMIRRRFLIEHNLWHDEAMRLGEDYDLYARSLVKGARFVIIPAHGYVCMSRNNSLSTKHTVEDLRRLLNCDKLLASNPLLRVEEREALHRHSVSISCRIHWRLLLEAVEARQFKLALSCLRQPWPIPAELLSMSFSRFFLHCGMLLRRAFASVHYRQNE